jgi:hypothetical protein
MKKMFMSLIFLSMAVLTYAQTISMKTRILTG